MLLDTQPPKGGTPNQHYISSYHDMLIFYLHHYLTTGTVRHMLVSGPRGPEIETGHKKYLGVEI